MRCRVHQKFFLKKLNYKKKIKVLDPKKLKSYRLDNTSINLIDIKYETSKAFEKISSKSNNYIKKCFDTSFKIIKKYKIKKFINGPINKKTFLNKQFLGITEYISYKFNTKTLHSGHQPDKNYGSRAVPIYQSTSYLFQDTDHAAALFNLEEGGHIYSRISNPTVAVLEERVAALEGGSAALATASGMSAIFLTIMTLCNAGDHMVVSSQLYGGTVNLFRLTLPKFGIKTTFVKPRDTEGFKKAIQPNTKGIFGELVGNPGNELMNMPEVSNIAKEAGIPLIIDSTYQTPYLCRPFSGCP